MNQYGDYSILFEYRRRNIQVKSKAKEDSYSFDNRISASLLMQIFDAQLHRSGQAGIAR
jgi:hypothetical protein